MAFYTEAYHKLANWCRDREVTLVAVSKIRTDHEIMEAYNAGQRDFGENYVQELISKAANLPDDIRWHFIGHLQTNKVKSIIHFVHLVQGVDNLKLLQELNKQASKIGKRIKCLLQVHIAREESKFGFQSDEVLSIDPAQYPYLEICGLMGMATFTDDVKVVKSEFDRLASLFNRMKGIHRSFTILSMGMSDDYQTAVEAGSNMIRVGSLIFGLRI